MCPLEDLKMLLTDEQFLQPKISFISSASSCFYVSGVEKRNLWMSNNCSSNFFYALSPQFARLEFGR